MVSEVEVSVGERPGAEWVAGTVFERQDVKLLSVIGAKLLLWFGPLQGRGP